MCVCVVVVVVVLVVAVVLVVDLVVVVVLLVDLVVLFHVRRNAHCVVQRARLAWLFVILDAFLIAVAVLQPGRVGMCGA